MADSPRKQMEKILALKTSSRWKRQCAQYILNHEEWLPLLSGHPAFYRDFVLSMIDYRTRFDLDDTAIPGIVHELTRTGKIWDIFNARKRPDTVAKDIILAARSIQCSGFDVTQESVKSVLDVLAEAGENWYVPFTIAEDEDLIHPLIIEKIIVDSEAAGTFRMLAQQGVRDPLKALFVVDEKMPASLVSGAL